MFNFIGKNIHAVLLLLLIGGLTWAAFRPPPILEMAESGAIKTWSAGETVTAADVNGAFQHIHNVMVGGHGARLTNSDVSGSAAIATSKLAGKLNIPWLWAYVTVTGCPGACVITTRDSSGGISGISRTGVGAYTVTFTPAVTATPGAAICTGEQSNAACYATLGSTTTLLVQTTDLAAAVTENLAFMFILMSH